jgi:hypothetical protein
VGGHLGALAAFAALTLLFQALSLRAFASSISVAGLGMLAIGFSLGVEPAVATALACAVVHAVRRRPKAHKALFNATSFALSTLAATGLYRGLDGEHLAALPQLGLAIAASFVFLTLNTGLLALAMAASERTHPLTIWRARLGWISPAYLAFGAVALLAAVAYRASGAAGVAVLAAEGAVLAGVLRAAFARARASLAARPAQALTQGNR